MNAYATLATLVAFAKDRLQREEKGATAVEYGLMVGLIAAVIVGTVLILGGQLDDLFKAITDALPGGVAAPPAG
jgi:pilus assembly protein Flp/PilA